MNIEELIQDKTGTIVDVRTPEEFSQGHAQDSINIPLQEIPQRLNELKELKAPLILCCASGGRSGNAQVYLSQLGLECYNAGSWLTVQHIQNN